MDSIKLENISKVYKIGSAKSTNLRDSLASSIKKLLPGKPKSEEFTAIKDISFSVKEGEVVGIIGKNGAGKSTLLKVLSRITDPTTGRIEINGRVASLLEVGTGFHPELTGRENIFLNGTILGMTRKEVKSKFDEIVEFSGIEKFIDTPVKRYSSGMYVRLAFAVAAHLEPEILIIDEVLAVGDAEFQKKCIGKMGEVAKKGRTVLFVSHNMDAVNSFCTRGIVMRNGEMVFDGETQLAINEYLKNDDGNNGVKTWSENKPGDDLVSLNKLELLNNANQNATKFKMDESIRLEFSYTVHNDTYLPFPNIHLYKSTGEYVMMALHPENTLETGKGDFIGEVEIPKNLLNNGTFMIGLAMTTLSPWKVHFYERDCLSFEVVENISQRENIYTGQYPGVIRPEVIWKNKKL